MIKKILFLCVLFLLPNSSSTVTIPALPSHTLPVPIYRQEKEYSCGAAALLSVMYYWQAYNGEEKDLYPLLETDPQQGTEGIKIAEVAKSFGLDAKIDTDVTFSQLRTFLREGKTAILEIQAWPLRDHGNAAWRNIWNEGHFVTLIGMDELYGYFMDSAVENAYMYVPLEELNERWHNWAVGTDGVNRAYQHFSVVISGENSIQTPISPKTPLVRLE